MKRRVFMIAAIALGLALVTGVGVVTQATNLGGTEPVFGGTLVISQSVQAVHLDPFFSDDVHSSRVMMQIYDLVLNQNPDTLEIEPGIASSWDISEDGKTIILNIRRGIAFHNGEALTAEDVAFSIQRLQDQTTIRYNHVAWIDEVSVVAKYTLLLRTETPSLDNLAKLIEVPVVPKDTVEKVGKDAFDRNPVGSGPFVFNEWIVDERITLLKNANYWLTEPYVDEVVFKPIPEKKVAALALEAGEVDITDDLLPEDISAFREMPEIEVMQAPSVLYYYVGFNCLKEPYSDVRFRKAVYYSVDMDDAIQKIFQGLSASRAYSTIPPRYTTSDVEYLRANVALPKDDEKADALFAELRAEGLIPENLTVTINTPTDAYRKQLGTIIATNLIEHGINAVVEPLEWAALLPRLYDRKEGEPRNLDMYIVGSSAGTEAQLLLNAFLSENARLTGASNYSDYMNPMVDALLNEAVTTLDTQRRSEVLIEVQRMIMQDYPHIPAYNTLSTHGVSARVHDFKASAVADHFLIVSPWNNVWLEASG
jgi:peptide/nickel transport system substrate-binding protein